MAYTDPIIRRFAVACGVLSQYTSQPADIEPAGGEQQLTIFYAGRMVVVDRCTPARAAELIRYAAAAQQGGAPEPPALVDMPIARKASLQRFLTKRKYRANAIVPEPYGLPAAAPEQPPPAKKSKAADGERRQDDWLALGSLGDMHAR